MSTMSFFNSHCPAFLFLCFWWAGVTFGDNLPCDGCKECIPSPSSYESKENCQLCTLGLNRDWPCKTECVCDDFSIGTLQCEAAVSKDLISSNKVCREICNSVKSGERTLEDFEAICEIEKYRYDLASEKVILQGNCFNQWIYGYSDEGLYGMDDLSPAQVGRLLEKPLTSASECQEECQKSDTCENWSWRVRANEGVTKEVFEHDCLLKTAEMVNKALNIKVEGMKYSWTSIGATDERYKWCNMGLGYKCSEEGGYVCKKCDGLRCVFKSEHHIAGPKFCGKLEDECKPLTTVNTPTAIAVTTFATTTTIKTSVITNSTMSTRAPTFATPKISIATAVTATNNSTTKASGVKIITVTTKRITARTVTKATPAEIFNKTTIKAVATPEASTAFLHRRKRKHGKGGKKCRCSKTSSTSTSTEKFDACEDE